jgi:electron transport complex protein RnfC
MEGSFDRLGSGGGDGADTLRTEPMGYAKLVGILDECGIVEMEGSGLPVTGMLRGFRDSGGGTVVVKCVFDDPWLAADRVLCSLRMKAVIEGAFILAGSCGGAGRVILAVSYREMKLGEAMLAEADGHGIPVSLVLTGDRYPQRNRREMEMVLRGYGERAKLDLGSLLMLGPATLVAVRDAVMRRSPVLERYVAVGGSAVRNPGVLKARIGKRIGDLFEECGGFVAPPFRVVSGSPFFGETVRYLDEPVSRTSYALVAMLAPQAGMRRETDCISCGECRMVCPVGLDPEELYKTATSVELGGKIAVGSSDCHGCGCCEVVCPSGIGLASVIMGGAWGKPDA